MSLGLNLDKIRNYLQTNQNVGAIVLQKTQAGNVSGFKEAGFLHKLKSFFGVSSAKNANASTIREITNAIQNDSKLCAGLDRAQELLAAVKGTITTEKLRSILTNLDDHVRRMDPGVYKGKVRDAVSGYLAAQGAPAFLKGANIGVNLNNHKQFMTWYNKAAAAHVLGKSNGGLSGTLMNACASGISEFNDSFSKYLKVFKNYLSYPGDLEKGYINAFAKKCMDGEILVTTQEGTLDDGKTMTNVMQLYDQFKRTTAIEAYGGKNFLDWYNKTAAACVRDNQGQVPDNWQDSLDGRTEFDQFFGKCLDLLDGKQSRIEAFAKKCMAGKMLVTTQDGAVDQEKTLANVTRLNEHLKLTETTETMNKLGLDKNQEFMDWYNKAADVHALGKQAQAPGSGKAFFDGRTEFGQFFGRCLDLFEGDQSRIKTFAEKCVTGKMLVTTPEGTLDRDKTLANVKRLNKQFELTDEIGKKEPPSVLTQRGLDKDQKFMAWYNFTSAGLALGKQAQDVSLGKQAQDEWLKEDQLDTHRTKFDQFFDKCLSLFDGNQSHIKTFAEKCMAGEILVTTPEGALDRPKTLEKVQQLKGQLDMAE